MRIDILTVVPELLTSPLNESILHRAQEKGLVQIVVHNLHDYAHDRRKTTDDYPFGGEAGMVLKCEPVFELIEKLQSERHYDEIIYTSPDGVRYLDPNGKECKQQADNVLLAIGAKGIGAFQDLDRERLYPRVLPVVESILACQQAGIPTRNIIALHGPFSRDLNRAMLEQYHIRYLVTKDGGRAGGFEEKAAAAREAGAELVVIGRPTETGCTLEEILSWLTQD